MTSKLRLLAPLVAVLAITAACSKDTTTDTGGTTGGTTATTTAGTTPGSAKTTDTARSTDTGAGAAVVEGEATLTVVETPYGDAVGLDSGLVVYAWEQDGPGEPTCLDSCAEKWPPVIVDGESSLTIGEGLDETMFTIVDRPDGTKQVALNDRPLYRMAIDEPGEANCQGASGWYIQNPDGTWNKSTNPVEG